MLDADPPPDLQSTQRVLSPGGQGQLFQDKIFWNKDLWAAGGDGSHLQCQAAKWELVNPPT